MQLVTQFPKPGNVSQAHVIRVDMVAGVHYCPRESGLVNN